MPKKAKRARIAAPADGLSEPDDAEALDAMICAAGGADGDSSGDEDFHGHRTSE